nr:MAG TPA: hypothetical protein [Caudoviricetes sp.]
MKTETACVGKALEVVTVLYRRRNAGEAEYHRRKKC